MAIYHKLAYTTTSKMGFGGPVGGRGGIGLGEGMKSMYREGCGTG